MKSIGPTTPNFWAAGSEETCTASQIDGHGGGPRNTLRTLWVHETPLFILVSQTLLISSGSSSTSCWGKARQVRYHELLPRNFIECFGSSPDCVLLLSPEGPKMHDIVLDLRIPPTRTGYAAVTVELLGSDRSSRSQPL